jgi:hypothetical protein
MDQSEIIEILNRHVFNEDKIALITAIAKNPDRFVGVFPSTTPRLKVLQNLLQSREIRFGDAMEEIVALLLGEMGYKNLDKRFLSSEDEDLSADQYFCSADQVNFYLMEQKVRDDHDSTKKRGQVENFRKKLVYLKALHGNSLIGIMYFMDPSLRKNKRYYEATLDKLREDLQIPIYLFYDGEIFPYLQGNQQSWDLLLSSLYAWRKTVPEQIYLNYDAEPEKTLAELSEIPGGIWYKLIANNALWEGGVIQALFPNGTTLRLLEAGFRQNGGRKLRAGRSSISFLQLAALLQMQLDKYYPR